MGEDATEGDLAPGERTVAFEVAYDGSRFHGSQLQPDHPTVQGALERALARVLPGPRRIRLAGRTDAGVHATGQVVAFEPGVPIPLGPLRHLVNAKVGPGIRLGRAWEARPGFHPRFDALGRAYRYVLDASGAAPDPFRGPYVTFPGEGLDWGRAREGIPALLGTHDFRAFCTRPSDAERPVRSLDALVLREHAGMVLVDLRARAFLRGQVRHLVAALLAVARGEKDPSYMDELLALGARGEKDARLTPAPPEGLYLMKVEYPDGLPGPEGLDPGAAPGKGGPPFPALELPPFGPADEP